MAIIDALSWPAWAFYGAGSNKTPRVMVLAVASVLGIGVLLGAWYLLGARPSVKRQRESFSTGTFS